MTKLRSCLQVSTNMKAIVSIASIALGGKPPEQARLTPLEARGAK
jgi:hypothetical protein